MIQPRVKHRCRTKPWRNKNETRVLPPLKSMFFQSLDTVPGIKGVEQRKAEIVSDRRAIKDRDEEPHDTFQRACPLRFPRKTPSIPTWMFDRSFGSCFYLDQSLADGRMSRSRGIYMRDLALLVTSSSCCTCRV